MLLGFLQWGFCEAKQESCGSQCGPAPLPSWKGESWGDSGTTGFPLIYCRQDLGPCDLLWGSLQVQVPMEEELLWGKPGFQPGMQDHSWGRSNPGWGRHSEGANLILDSWTQAWPDGEETSVAELCCNQRPGTFWLIWTDRNFAFGTVNSLDVAYFPIYPVYIFVRRETFSGQGGFCYWGRR